MTVLIPALAQLCGCRLMAGLNLAKVVIGVRFSVATPAFPTGQAPGFGRLKCLHSSMEEYLFRTQRMTVRFCLMAPRRFSSMVEQ
jgi:hypothetical protein